jgi:hypothetical protein
MTGGGSSKERYVGWDPSKGTALDRSLLSMYMKRANEDVIRQQELDRMKAAAATQGEQEIRAAGEAGGRMGIAPGSMRAAMTVMPATAERNMNIAMQDVAARRENVAARTEAERFLNDQFVLPRAGRDVNTSQWQNTTENRTQNTKDPLASLGFQWNLLQPQGKVSTNTGYSPWANFGGAAAGAAQDYFGAKMMQGAGGAGGAGGTGGSALSHSLAEYYKPFNPYLQLPGSTPKLY